MDVSLISGIDSDAIKRTLASSLIDFARQTKTSVIAEGVETASEYDALQRLHPQTLQGYYFSRPAAFEQLKALLQGPLPAFSSP